MKKNTLLKIIIILSIGFTASCNAITEQFNMDQPEVVSVSPSNGQSSVPMDTAITVQFSKEMDCIKTNEEFTLSTSEGSIDGFFSWEDGGKTLVFTPMKYLADSNVYYIYVSSSAEDADGNDLKDDFYSTFYITTDDIAPEVVSTYPLNDAVGIFPGSNIQITFSEAVNIDYANDAFSLSPSIEGSISWNPAHTVFTFTPLYSFAYGTTYTVSISENLIDTAGNNLKEQSVFNFTVGDDFIQPQILGFCQDGGIPWTDPDPHNNLEKDIDLLIIFSENISPSSIYDAINISSSSSSVDFTPLMEPPGPPSTTIRLQLNEVLDCETLYTVVVKDLITDLQDNPLDREYVYRFFTNGPDSLLLEIAIYDTEEAAFWDNTVIEELTLPGADPVYPGIEVRFSNALGDVDINPVTIEVTAVNIFGSSSNPIVIDPEWNSPDFDQYTFSLYDIVVGNTYKVTVKGDKDGVRDVNGNYLKEDHVQYIRFPIP